MGLDQWAVHPADTVGTTEQFILELRDMPTTRTPPFASTIGPMSETELRMELRKLDVSEEEANAAIAQARASRDK